MLLDLLKGVWRSVGDGVARPNHNLAGRETGHPRWLVRRELMWLGDRLRVLLGGVGAWLHSPLVHGRWGRLG